MRDYLGRFFRRVYGSYGASGPRDQPRRGERPHHRAPAPAGRRRGSASASLRDRRRWTADDLPVQPDRHVRRDERRRRARGHAVPARGTPPRRSATTSATSGTSSATPSSGTRSRRRDSSRRRSHPVTPTCLCSSSTAAPITQCRTSAARSRRATSRTSCSPTPSWLRACAPSRSFSRRTSTRRSGSRSRSSSPRGRR